MLFEVKFPIPTVPALFSKPRTAISNPYPNTTNIPKCAQDGTSDYEAKLIIVIEETARNITAEQVPNFILGYTAANDVLAEAIKKSAMPCSTKGIDSSCPLGKCNRSELTVGINLIVLIIIGSCWVSTTGI